MEAGLRCGSRPPGVRPAHRPQADDEARYNDTRSFRIAWPARPRPSSHPNSPRGVSRHQPEKSPPCDRAQRERGDRPAAEANDRRSHAGLRPHADGARTSAASRRAAPPEDCDRNDGTTENSLMASSSTSVPPMMFEPLDPRRQVSPWRSPTCAQGRSTGMKCSILRRLAQASNWFEGGILWFTNGFGRPNITIVTLQGRRKKCPLAPAILPQRL